MYRYSIFSSFMFKVFLNIKMKVKVADKRTEQWRRVVLHRITEFCGKVELVRVSCILEPLVEMSFIQVVVSTNLDFRKAVLAREICWGVRNMLEAFKSTGLDIPWSEYISEREEGKELHLESQYLDPEEMKSSSMGIVRYPWEPIKWCPIGQMIKVFPMY